MIEENTYCYYSDLPSPMAYMQQEEVKKKISFTPLEIDRIIEMAWEDRTSFDAIELQFGLKESEVKLLMKKQLRFSSYVLWRKRIEACHTKHELLRSERIIRFKSNRQRAISSNKISKRKHE